jgi:hypothetical protein
MRHTAGFAGGLDGTGAGFFGCCGTSSSFAGCFEETMAGAFLAGGPAGRPDGGPPALHFTVAFSKASLILVFRKSGKESIIALSGRSPTIFIRVPKQVAASLRAPSNPSSNNTTNESARGLTCGGCMGEVAEARHLPKNFKVPSLTWGFLDFRARSKSGRMSVSVTCRWE